MTSTISLADFTHLPGADLVQRGLADLEAGRSSVEAWLVLVGAPRLRRSGIPVPARSGMPEHELYRMLSNLHGDGAHSKYNALLRRLISFERSLEQCVK